jgi:hypothetical protein
MGGVGGLGGLKGGSRWSPGADREPHASTECAVLTSLIQSAMLGTFFAFIEGKK